MLKKITLTFLLAVCAFAATAAAQNAPIAPEKIAAIKELTAMMSDGNQIEDTVKAIAGQMDNIRAETVKSLLDDRKDLTPAERQEVEKILADSSAKMKNYHERLLQKVDYKAMMDEMMIATYDKMFTLAEINDLLVFYKTPTGQKLLKQTPVLMAESMKTMQEKFLPKMIEAMKALEREDRRELEQKINARKPRPKKSNTK